MSDKRRGELQCIAKHLCDDLVQVLFGALHFHLDDLMAPIKRALLPMDGSKNFGFPRNIGIAFSTMSAHDSFCSLHSDWDPWLQPNVQRKHWAFDMSFLQNSHDKPTKQSKEQQHANQAHTSQPHPQPLTRKACLLPSPKPDIVQVKTPRRPSLLGLTMMLLLQQ